MSPELHEWTNLALRWFHVVAGVFWLGQTAFFSWLDARMTIEADEHGNERVWMVHSGGFYLVEKQKVPTVLPRILHWFRWEAAFSWLSGLALLVLVYYLGGALVEPDQEIGRGLAAIIASAALVVGWIVYDLLWARVPDRFELPTTLFTLLLLAGASLLFAKVLSGRAAYIHVGALLGTVMTANVWMRILPAQRRLVESVRNRTEPDLALARRAKQRSRHNTFMALPLLFIMISNHFPTTSYGHRLNWLMLLGFIGVGFAAREVLNRIDRR